jgi:SAM-dependent methyltransferase
LDPGETSVTEKDPSPSIPAETYTREYYETCCQGHEEFSESGGTRLPLRLSIPLELAGVESGMWVIDVGCGRGEILLHCAQRGARAWGLDYAREAVGLAREAVVNNAGSGQRELVGVGQANATQLPFADESADLVFMLDVVEHLYPLELKAAFDEAYRVLKSGGRLVVHTMPNLWYYRYGYPVYRGLQRLRGERLPADPRLRWDFRHVHVNEQTPASLRKALKASGFKAQVWLSTTQSYEYETNPLVKRGMVFLVNSLPFKWAFCNDIFAIGAKGNR